MPVGATYWVAAGMKGVWFAGLMKPQPSTMTMSTMVTFVITMMLLTQADSCVPRTRRAVRTNRMPIAGRFMMPCTLGSDAMRSIGEWYHWKGMLQPASWSTRLKYSLQAIATVAAPTAYSRQRSQPMIQATSSPMVA
jgi:hypothetical protein